MITPKCYSYIRFSSPEQRKGDSIRRQADLAQKYAEKHNLELDTELTLEDQGLSAYSGAHRKKGALGLFLELIESDEVPEGSTLIVESLDRLSREKVLVAFGQFQNIINYGIKIVTLTDGMEYSRENIDKDFTKLLISLTIMSRSYEESLQKSKRVKSAWDEKRNNLDHCKLTSRSPAWVNLSADKSTFELDEQRAEIIRQIFTKSANGYGIAKIAKHLNEEGVESWGKGKGWHSSYIHKILRNRSVLGEFQPHILQDQKRVPAGEPISEYFPKVIDDALFYQVQSRLTANASYSGKTGAVSNLFGGLAKCGYCNSPMQFVNKGKKPKGGTYLVCDSARRGRGCDYISIAYDEVESAILTLCDEIDIDLIFPDDKSENKKLADKFTKTIEACDEKIKQLERQLDNLLNNLSDEDNEAVVKRIKERMVDLENESDRCKNERIVATNKLAEVVHEKEVMKNRILDIRTLYRDGYLRDVDVRIRLRSTLRSIINNISITPAQRKISEEAYELVLESEIMSHEKTGEPYDIEKITRDVKESTFYGVNDKRMRTIRLDFKNGKTMLLVPCQDDSASYYMDLEIDGKRVTKVLSGETRAQTHYIGSHQKANDIKKAMKTT